MDLVIGLLWSLAFTVIVLFLGALNYFLGRSDSDIKRLEKKCQSETINQQQSNRTSANRRKHARNANKKQRQQAAAAAATAVAAMINDNLNSDNNNNEDKQEVKSTLSEKKNEEESSVQPTDEEQEQKEEFEDPINIEEVLTPSPPILIQEEQKPMLLVKQRNKNKSNHINSKSSQSSISSKEESILLTKPQASVAPVKQFLPLNIESTQILQDNNSKSNEKCNIYSYSEQNSLPPRFQQKEISNLQKFRKRKPKKSSVPIGSASRQNDFIPSISPQQIGLPLQSSDQNDYLSESDILTESSSTAPSLSTESQFSLTRSDINHSLSSSNISLDELVSIFDTTSFSTDELQLILNKITTKHLSNKQDRQRLLTTTKNEKTIERILDETSRSQAKILAIELQTEKNRVLELTKINAEMDSTIRQLQQPNNNMLPYQQTILSYQMQIRRLTDDNARLVHQLRACSIMPATINELKQQQTILNEQLKQIIIRNNNLEKEIADGERASKNAAEIYKRADNQKQERIEQMANDINKYKKIEKDLNTLQINYNELEKGLNLKLNNIIHQRDDLQRSCDELKDKTQEYEQLKIKYDQLYSGSNIDQLQQELNEAKTKNDLLRQRNWKIMEQLNKLLHEQKQNQSP